MSVLESHPHPTAPPARRPPPLESGDRLTRAEFERRYAAMPNVNKAQLIEGVVYMPSPVRHRHHSKPQVQLATWLGTYIARTPGLEEFGDNGTVRLDEDNEPQPDLFLLLPPHAGGQARIDEDDYITGSPDLICEIAGSSVSIDLHAKLNAYRRNGVREYLIWRTDDQAVDWFILHEGRYVPIPAEEDLLKSRIFPGLWLDPRALLSGNLPALLAPLDRSTATEEHRQFVEKLRGKS